MTNDHMDFERVLIKCTLTCKSDLHISSGLEAKYQLMGDLGKKAGEQLYADICLDYSGAPYIPASTLRGYLARHSRTNNNIELHNVLFGCAHNKNNESGMGKLRIYDSTFIEDGNNEPATYLRTCAAIEPITGTNKAHQLFTYKLVETGCQFSLKIELDKPGKEELTTLLSLLACLDGSETSQIGKNKSLMMGRLAISEVQVKAMYECDFIKWLQTTDDAIEKYFLCIDEEKGEKPRDISQYKKLNLTLYPTSPILVNDIHRVKGEKEQPDLVFTHKRNRLCIPASTLKGLIKAHCRKILLTMLHNKDGQNQQYQNHQKIADQMIDEIFGDKNIIGLIRVSDAISKTVAIDHHQTFIAIDRFTGGAADGKLCMSHAAIVEKLPCELFLDQRLFEKDWAIGLLIFVLRDAMESDLKIGWGKSKGFGTFKLAITNEQSTDLRDWSDILNYINPDELKNKVEALEHKITGLAGSGKENTEEQEIA